MANEDKKDFNAMLHDSKAVSYTHLDVYKRQVFILLLFKRKISLKSLVI